VKNHGDDAHFTTPSPLDVVLPDYIPISSLPKQAGTLNERKTHVQWQRALAQVCREVQISAYSETYMMD
jgi:hypothetical protein